MTPLQRLRLLISSGLHAARDSGRYLIKRKLLLAGLLLAAASLVCVLAAGQPTPLLPTFLSDSARFASDAWVMFTGSLQLLAKGENDGTGVSSGGSPSGVWSLSASFDVFDLKITLAVLLGATISYLFNFASAAVRERLAGRAASGSAAAGQNEAGSDVPGPGAQPLEQIPDNACYFCIRRPATSKCGSCRLVYYCCRLCQMQAWRKHRHVCGAAAAAAGRIHRSRSLISPSQWRDLVDYCEYVKGLVPSATVVPTAPEVVAEILRKIGAYIRERPELVSQQMADAAWAQALSMRSEGQPDRLHMAWAWGFLEAAVESGSADAFLTALRINDAAAADLPRVNRWMKRGLCQALLMLNKRQEVGGFFRAAPMQQLLYF